MAFTPLSSRIAGLPDLLVGPILRLVTATEVSVFLAFKAKTKVTLKVYASEVGGAGVNEQMSGTRSTVPMGAGGDVKLHVVCVTATGTALVPGTQYVYDVKLGAHGNDGFEATGRGLFADDVVRASGADARQLLTYPAGPQLPSFVLAPDDVDDLRILHASCRKPHGEGRDALAVGDEILASSFTGPDPRPQQLFLGGDQIYADDVAVGLLFLLQDAARPTALALPVEQLPTKAGDQPGSAFRPGNRGTVVKEEAGFTSGEAGSHLMTFADYALMYAFAWSDALWPPELPGFKDAMPAEHAEWEADHKAALEALEDGRRPRAVRHRKLATHFDEEMAHVARYREALPAVRRLLANVPTLMIFDDHEVTDDWNLNLDWIKRTQDPAKLADAKAPTALARAILRNGLAAFAVFQAWGNTPGAFRAAQNDPGTQLLGALAGWNGTSSGAQVTEMATRVGMPTGFDDHVATPVAGSIAWHYSASWAAHQVIVLDTRTRRGTVKKEDSGGPPALIYAKADFDAMVHDVPAPQGDALTLVVAPAPVFGVPLHEAAARYLKAPWQTISASADPEHWALTPYAREHFVSALLSRGTAGADGVIRSRAVILSGDVHHGSAVHVRYSAAKPFRYPGKVEGVIAQLTSSALKNEAGLTRFIETMGFFTRDQRWELITGHNMPLIEVNGWENSGGDDLEVGNEFYGQLNPFNVKIEVEGSPGIHEITYTVPFRDPPAQPAMALYQLTAVPEWKYAVRPARGVLVGRPAPMTLPANATSRDQKVQRAVAAAHEQRRAKVSLASGQEVVGHNNIGDVTFEWGAGDDKVVIQDLWWRPEDDLAAAPYTRWEIKLGNGTP